TSGGAFSDICCLQISRFTASKPSKSAIASVEKFTRQLTTLIARYFLKSMALPSTQGKPPRLPGGSAVG
ncbi:MAG: hypothetical protein IJ189_01700, partial [Clostridia bacterium]|nr:hypothetical protein [Clostridia bacterium]MBQ9262907.1 hypothetical protein [Clostridia bacterium]